MHRLDDNLLTEFSRTISEGKKNKNKKPLRFLLAIMLAPSTTPWVL